jgi:nucleotide-binding universal stress UspA family protein
MEPIDQNAAKAKIKRVLHPTDFSEGSAVAFQHALKITLLTKSKLNILGLGGEGSEEFPGVRETLERWQLLPKGSPRSAVPKLGIDARKIIADRNDPAEAVLRFLESRPVDLVVLATLHQKGLGSWLGKSVAQPVARRAEEMTLFIPDSSAGFVAAADGSVSLERILIPIAKTPQPQAAVDAACALVAGLNCPQGTFTLMHVGQSAGMPRVRRPDIPGWEWKDELRTGDVIQTIVDTANEINADLVVMATDGRSGFLEGLRGSHSERVLRQTGVPLLTVPVTVDDEE